MRTDVLAISPPARRVRHVLPGPTESPRTLTTPGATGFRVITYRLLSRSGEWRRERLSDDTYQAADRIVRIVDPEP